MSSLVVRAPVPGSRDAAAAGSGAERPRSLPPTLRGLAGQGHRLPDDVRSYFEARFGYSLEHVRVHTGSDAARLARNLGAHAFTTGSHIGFAANRWAPHSFQGRRLLAHEITHVLQQDLGQAGGRIDGVPGISATRPADPTVHRAVDLESRAERLVDSGIRPRDLPESEAEGIGHYVLRVIGYDRLLQWARDTGIIVRRPVAAPPRGNDSPVGPTVFRAAAAGAVFVDVFTEWAVTAGIASQADSPAPGPADVVALGILAVGLVVATVAAFKKSSPPGIRPGPPTARPAPRPKPQTRPRAPGPEAKPQAPPKPRAKPQTRPAPRPRPDTRTQPRPEPKPEPRPPYLGPSPAPDPRRHAAYPLCWPVQLGPPTRGFFVRTPRAERDEDEARQARMQLEWRRFRDPDFDASRYHVHHVVPLFLGGADDLRTNGTTIPGRLHLRGHAVLRKQPQMLTPPPPLRPLPEDIYQHPPGTPYVLAGFKQTAREPCP